MWALGFKHILEQLNYLFDVRRCANALLIKIENDVRYPREVEITKLDLSNNIVMKHDKLGHVLISHGMNNYLEQSHAI